LKSFEIPRDDAWPAGVPLEIQYPDFCWTSKKPRNLEHVQLKQAKSSQQNQALTSAGRHVSDAFTSNPIVL
jgi:hypothetical protein